jgi:DNA-binding HxlR family transcriptional regulator
MNESEPQTERWDTISFVISSDYRLLVLDQLAGPEIPSRITTDGDEHVLTEHVTRALSELRDRELVELHVLDDQEEYRFYRLTEGGEQVWQWMHTAGLT